MVDPQRISRTVEPALSASPTRDPTVAIAFGGGGARGYAHIHIMEVMDEMGIRPVEIAGSSIGSVMGAAMASGISGAEIRDYTMSLVGNRADVISRFWQTRPSRLTDIVEGGLRFGQFRVDRILKAFLPEGIGPRFEDLKIPLSVIATDYYAHRQCVLTSGDLYSAMAASAAIPAVFRPVERDGRILIDGGIVNPVPYDCLVGRADIVIGVDVVGAPAGDETRAPTTVESLYGATQLMMQTIMALKLTIAPPDIFIRPPVSKFRVLDFMRAGQILDATATIRDEFKYKLDGAIAAWRAEVR